MGIQYELLRSLFLFAYTLQMTQEQTALARWGLGDALVAPLTGGTANANFRIDHASGVYVLRRRSPRYVRSNQLAFDHALMRHLADQGIRGPNPLGTADGATWVTLDDAVYELHRFLEGRPVEWTRLEDLRIAAESLRRWHEAAATFVPPVDKNYPREDAPEDIRAGIAELRDVLRQPEEAAVLDALSAWTDRIAQALPDSLYRALPNQIVHGDFHPGNVHVAENALGIFDLDCASYQPRARDVADGMLYFCARRDGPFDASTIERLTRECWLEPERNRMFLEAYGPLTRQEYAALPWLMAARWIYSRVRGRLKLPREKWPSYVAAGVLTPLEALDLMDGNITGE